MSLELLRRHLQEQHLRPAYLFYGEEELLLRRTLQYLEKWLEKREGIAARYDLSPDHATLAELLTLLQSPPLWGGRQVVVVWQAEKFWPEVSASDRRSKRRQTGGALEAAEMLARYLETPATANLLLLVCLGLKDSDLKKTRLWQALGSRLTAIYFPKLKEKEVLGWVTDEARRLGKTLAPGVAELLVELVGPDLSELAQELEKLALYSGSDTCISRDMVTRLSGASRHYTVFELGEALGQRDPLRALKILHRLLSLGEPPALVVTLLARQLRLLLKVCEAAPHSPSPAELAKKLGVHEFVARRLSHQAAGWSPAQLLEALLRLQEVDAGLKTGTQAPALLLENFLLTLSRPAKTAGRPKSLPDG